MKIVYTVRARQDLRDIYDYSAFTLLVPETASKITDKIRALDSMPDRNPLYKEEPWHSKGVHFLPVNNDLVFYTVDHSADMVSIARIMYGGRGIRHQLNETNER